MKRNDLLKVLLGTGLYMLDPVRDRLAGRLDDLTERAQDTLEAASDRVDRVTKTIRGNEHSSMNNLFMMLLGVGVGVGIGMLLAPASGEQLRGNLADKVQDLGSRVKDRFSEGQQNTGTYGGI
jgi:YtxH-like protein